jgi:60 kDa SS-A/Ro ribonucleoprotein
MTPTQFSIADPNDAGMLDVAGFDTSTPQVISEFSK